MSKKKKHVDEYGFQKKKIKKKKMKLNNFLMVVCVVSGILYFSSVMLLKSHNLSLNYKIEEIKTENNEKAKELESLQVEVSRLEDRVNIQEFADTHGLKYDTDNIFYIQQEEKKEYKKNSDESVNNKQELQVANETEEESEEGVFEE